MFFRNIFVKANVFDAEEKQNSVRKPKNFANNFTSTINTVWIDVIERVFNSNLINNCRKQIKFNLDDWWIMHLHHIGLPPATNRYSKLSVSGNSLIKTKLI